MGNFSTFVIGKEKKDQELLLTFKNIDSTIANFDILDKTNINQWNTYFESKSSMTFDKLIYNSGSNDIKFLTRKVPVDSMLNLQDMALLNIQCLTEFENLYGINLNGNNCETVVNYQLPINLKYLDLTNNAIQTEFNNTVELPQLKELRLSHNNLNKFSPLIDLPISLSNLYLDNNNISDISQINFPINLLMLQLSFNKLIDIQTKSDLPLTLRSLHVSNNLLTAFIPTIKFNSLLTIIDVENNFITREQWNNNTQWINAVRNGDQNIFNSGGNVASISGTNTETLLLAKEWLVNV